MELRHLHYALIVFQILTLLTSTTYSQDCSQTAPLVTCHDNVTKCLHGRCVSVLKVIINRPVVVSSCNCSTGWSGSTCEVCLQPPLNMGITMGTSRTHATTDISTLDLTMDTAAEGVTTIDTPTNVTFNQPLKSLDLTTSSTVIKEQYCMGALVLDVPPTSCSGLTCQHGRCQTTEIGSGWGLGHKCLCHTGWSGSFCDLCCDLDCNDGTCLVDIDSGDKFCVCHNSNYTASSNCTELHQDPEPPTSEAPQPPGKWVEAVIGIGAGLLFCLLLTLLLLPCYMWRKRHILMLKIVHYFQKYDETERPYHVFISFRSGVDDLRFVTNKLHPKLVEMNLRVCVHYKDFQPGASIAENIIEAIENSSRTILLISPEFCEAEWPRFEVQAAQREMLKLRHRIIPIIFKDISETRAAGRVDPLLRNILDSVTYLEWPGEEDNKAEKKFWERLRLAMPKVLNEPQTDAFIAAQKMHADDARLTSVSVRIPGRTDSLDSMELESSLDSGVELSMDPCPGVLSEDYSCLSNNSYTEDSMDRLYTRMFNRYGKSDV